MIILDTDHLSILQHFDSPHAIELRQRILAVEEQRIVTTIVTYEEQVRSWLSQIGRRSDVIEQVPFYDHLIEFAAFFTEWELLPFDEDAAKIFNQLCKQRIRISSTDLKISSIAINCEAKLLSRNIVDFEKVPGLIVENWLPN